MRLSTIRLGVLMVPSWLAVAAVASAQPAPAASPGLPQMQLRSQISIMEGVLERSVVEGIRGAVGQMPDVFPAPPFITPPRARGFRVEGYGVFFDVEVPTLPASVWSINVINRNNEIAVINEISQMRALLQSVSDAGKRAELARALDRMQARVSGAALSEPGAPPARTVSDHTAPASVAPAPRPAALPQRDPADVYTDEVKKALVSAMLVGINMQIGMDEWFTVAASEPRGGWGDSDTLTMYLSIKGKDLAALSAKQISAEEAAKRIVVRNF